jgi:hypothetical protein
MPTQKIYLKVASAYIAEQLKQYGLRSSGGPSFWSNNLVKSQNILNINKNPLKTASTTLAIKTKLFPTKEQKRDLLLMVLITYTNS